MEQKHEWIAKRVVWADVGEVAMRPVVKLLQRLSKGRTRGTLGIEDEFRKDRVLLRSGSVRSRRITWCGRRPGPRNIVGRANRIACGVSIPRMAMRAGLMIIEPWGEPLIAGGAGGRF